MTGLEAAFAALVLAALGRWLKRVALAVMLPWKKWGQLPDPAGIHTQQELWRTEVNTLVDWLQHNAVTREGFSTSSEVRRHLDTVRNLLVRIPDEVFEDIRRELIQGYDQGDSTKAIADKVQGILNVTGSENWPNRAQVIAVTEVNGALNAGWFGGAVAQQAQLRQPLAKKWLCVAPMTHVSAFQPREVMKRGRTAGYMTTITTQSGRVLTVTPDHPVLTRSGWVDAQFMAPGLHVVCYQPGVEFPGAPDVNDVPPQIQELFSTAAQIGPGVRMVHGSVDLYGHVANGHVQVVGVNGDLALHVQPCISQGGEEFLFSLTDVVLAHLVRECNSSTGLDAGEECALASLGVSAALSSQMPVLAGGDELASLGSSSESNALPEEQLAQGGVGNADVDCDGSQGLSRFIAFDKVNKVETTWVDGFHEVYDLSTDHGWYVAEGVIVHNSTHDSHTRPDHRQADGQIVPLLSPFIVGESALMYPGDKAGPPEQVINCRCTAAVVEAQ